jgi:hypothetical protein
MPSLPDLPDSSAGVFIGTRLFPSLVLLLIGGAILRSAIATRLDRWTQDEGYHTVAGVSRVPWGVITALTGAPASLLRRHRGPFLACWLYDQHGIYRRGVYH